MRLTCSPKLPSFSGRVSVHEGDYYEAIPFQRRTDYFDIKGARERPADEGCMPQAWHQLAQERRRFGYRRIGVMLERQGIHMNHKKLLRLYREEKLQVRKRGGRKRALGTRRPMVLPSRINERWSLDFVSDVSRMAAGSVYSPSLMIIAASVWRLLLTHRYLALVSLASLISSSLDTAVSPRRLFLTTGRSLRAWPY